MPDPQSQRSGWKRAAKLGVSLGLLAYVLGLVDLAEIGGVLAGTKLPLVGAAFAVYLAGQALSAVKWRALAQAVGFRRSRSEFLVYYFISMFFNAFGLGTVGGDVMRALQLAGGGGHRTLALNTVVADRVSGLLVLLAIAMVSLLLFRTYELPAVLYWTTVTVSGLILAGWRLSAVVAPRLLPAGSWPRKLVEEDLAPYWHDYRLLAQVSVMSLFFHLSQIAVLVLLARALGLSIPASYYLIFGPLVNVMSSIPISWNGLGIREGGYVYFLGHIGIDQEASVAFGLLWFSLVLLGGAIGGVLYLALGEAAHSESGSARTLGSGCQAPVNRSEPHGTRLREENPLDKENGGS